MRLSLTDIGILSIFFVFNLLLIHFLDFNLLGKKTSVFSIKNIGISFINTVIVGLPILFTVGLYIYTIVTFTVYLVELVSLYKIPNRQNVFIASFITFNIIAVDNFTGSISAVFFKDMMYEGHSTIGLVAFTLILLAMVIFFTYKLSNGVIDIITGNRIQSKLSNSVMIISIIILNILSIFESIKGDILYSITSFFLSFFLIIVVYLTLVYGYKVSADIWNSSSKNISSADLETNSNSEFDLSMYKNIDVLSGVYNKKFGCEKLCEYLQSDTMFCLVFINVNNFELVKSQNGQEWQDKYVKVVSETLKATYRENDFIFRFSDNKFMVILENCPTVAGEKTTSRAYNRVKQYAKEVGGTVDMSISFGCQEYHPNSGATIFDIENTSLTKMSEFNLKKNDIMDNSGVYNKKFGLNVLEDVCYKKQYFSVCAFQVNQVKAITDMYGKEEFDSMISIIGNTVIESFRARDTVSRFTENQFITIMPFCEQQEAKDVFSKVYSDILSVFKQKKKPYGIDITHNITYCSNDDDLMPNQLFIKIQDKLDELLKAELTANR